MTQSSTAAKTNHCTHTHSPTVQQLIDRFTLSHHPEGGFYRETYRSEQNVTLVETSSSVPKQRSANTAIYFLICPGHLSRLHRIQSDEVWHFYLGSPLKVVEVGHEFPSMFKETVLGQDIFNGQLVQYTVKGGTWFGCYPADDLQDTTANAAEDASGHIYSFVGCTVAPGFDFSDFELASRAKLLEEYPKASDVIIKLTHGLP